MNAIALCDKWAECPLLWCDPHHRMCQASHKTRQRVIQIFRQAKQNLPILNAFREKQAATASLGFKKYDRRRKNSRGYWREA